MIISYTNKYGKKVWEKEFSLKQFEKQISNPKVFKRAVIILGCALYVASNNYNPVVYAYGPNNIDKIGIKFWSYVKVFSKWSCLIMAGIDTVKGLNSGDAKSLSKILFKYILAYAIITLMPWFFEELENLAK